MAAEKFDFVGEFCWKEGWAVDFSKIKVLENSAPLKFSSQLLQLEMALFLTLKCHSGYKSKHNSTKSNHFSKKQYQKNFLNLEMGVVYNGPFSYPK